MIYIGIDCGLDGALAAIEDGKLVLLEDAPTVTLASAKGKRREPEPAAMAELLRRTIKSVLVRQSTEMIARELMHETIEYRQRPRQLALVLIEKQQTMPPHLKDARQGSAPEAPLTLAKHHGRADAILIAEYGRRTQECVA